MLYVCATRFDVTMNFEKFLISRLTKQDLDCRLIVQHGSDMDKRDRTIACVDCGVWLAGEELGMEVNVGQALLPAYRRPNFLSPSQPSALRPILPPLPAACAPVLPGAR